MPWIGRRQSARGCVQGSRGRVARGFAGDAVKVASACGHPGYRGLAAARVREGFCGGRVEISDQVVDQIYMGVRGECW